MKEDAPVQLETLDILADILNHFGSNLVSSHAQIFTFLISQLKSQRLAVRKRAILAIGYLVACCNSVLFTELLEVLLNELSKKQTNSLSKTYIQCLASIRLVTTCQCPSLTSGHSLVNFYHLILVAKLDTKLERTFQTSYHSSFTTVSAKTKSWSNILCKLSRRLSADVPRKSPTTSNKYNSREF